MSNVIQLRQRQPYLRDIEVLLETPVETGEGKGTQLWYRCSDRRTAARLSRWLRAESKRRGWRVAVKQFHEHVLVWKVLTPDEEDAVMRLVASPLDFAFPRRLRPVGGPGKPSRRCRPKSRR